MGSDGDEMSDVSVEESKDSFLDTFINFEKEIQKSKKDSMIRKRDVVEWSGQDVFSDRDPWILKHTTSQLS